MKSQETVFRLETDGGGYIIIHTTRERMAQAGIQYITDYREALSRTEQDWLDHFESKCHELMEANHRYEELLGKHNAIRDMALEIERLLREVSLHLSERADLIKKFDLVKEASKDHT